MENRTRREFILKSASNLYANKGVDNTTMEDIALESGYTRRTLYSYFGGHDEILFSIFINDMNTRWDKQKQDIALATTGLEKIIVWGKSFYEYALDNPHAMRLQIYWDFKGIDPAVFPKKLFNSFKTINDELADGLREIFRLGVKDGTLRPDIDVDLCISQFLYSLRSILNRALSTGYSFAKIDSGRYIEHFLDLFSRSIRIKGE